MTYPRSHMVDPEAPGYFHCVSRCVRRAFLCGTDRRTGRSFEHRKQWIENRILELAECFAVSIYAYSVMSNHFHVVVRVDPGEPTGWSAEDIARRWLRAFPGMLKGSKSPDVLERCVTALIANDERIGALRARLGSLSWFMRTLNEPIARMANKEDDCTGRFWEGRFKSQALLDQQAVLSCMTYVDLNPVRAGICEDMEQSDHTSVQRRLQATGRFPKNPKSGKPMLKKPLLDKPLLDKPLKPVAGLSADDLMDLTESNYIELVRWTGQQVYPGKRGQLRATQPTAAPATIGIVADHPNKWLRQVRATESRYYRAIGSAEALIEKAAELRQRWLKGISMARALRLLQHQQTQA